MLVRLSLLLLLLNLFCKVHAQNSNSNYVTISGTVYDISARNPIEAVAVMSSFGKGCLTDSLGHYTITVRSDDSIWFSMLGKTTVKYPIDTIKNTSSFDIMIHVRVAELPEVKVRSKNYRLDSIENRREYAKYFNYKRPSLQLSKSGGTPIPGSLTVAFDLDEIINMFRFKRNKMLEIFQRNLIQQEQDHYIDHRFSKAFVIKLTKLKQPELDSFMNRYRPGYSLLQLFNDIELGYYIEKCFEQFKANKQSHPEQFKKEE